jgi:hypothetical protein
MHVAALQDLSLHYCCCCYCEESHADYLCASNLPRVCTTINQQQRTGSYPKAPKEHCIPLPNLLLPPSLLLLLLLQVMQPSAAQLAAAVAALINALVASKFSTTGVMGMMNSVSYARWGLEGEQTLGAVLV